MAYDQRPRDVSDMHPILRAVYAILPAGWNMDVVNVASTYQTMFRIDAISSRGVRQRLTLSIEAEELHNHPIELVDRLIDWVTDAAENMGVPLRNVNGSFVAVEPKPRIRADTGIFGDLMKEMQDRVKTMQDNRPSRSEAMRETRETLQQIAAQTQEMTKAASKATKAVSELADVLRPKEESLSGEDDLGERMFVDDDE